MFVLRIEHTVLSYESWKNEAFDNDPLDRKGSGVVRYRIYRPTDNPKYVIIDLEFTSADEARAMLQKLTEMWGSVKERFGWDDIPTTHVLELAEQVEY